MDVLFREKGTYSFGPFRLDPVRRTLLRDGDRVPLTARLFDTLLYLVEHPDRLVEREELERAVWGGRTVETGNLARAISSLRRALMADDMVDTVIVTAPGRGYRLGLPVVFEPAPLPPLPAELTDLPSPQSDAAARRRAAPAVAVAALTLVVALLVWRVISWREPGFAPPRLSIIVMPFRTQGEDAHEAMLADNVADDLTADLRHLPGSVVKARESATRLAGRPVGEIGRALGVRYILDGRMATHDGTVQVQARLIDTVSGAQIWDHQYAATAASPWQTQEDIVHDIASALNVTLVDAEVARAARERPSNPDALTLFFQARSIMDRADTLDQLTTAQHLLERAIAAEPNFVEALSALGSVLVRKSQGYSDPTYAADDREADEVTVRALTIDKTNPLALAARGQRLASDGRCAQAAPIFDAALQADSSSLQALSGRAYCAWMDGRPEIALADLEAILRMDPLGPKTNHYDRLAGFAALFAGRYRLAVDFLLKCEARQAPQPADIDQLSPVETGRVYLIAAYALAGDLPQAQLRAQDFLAIWHHRSVWREMTFFDRKQAGTPGFIKVQQALQHAGLPMFTDEKVDDGVAASAMPLHGSDFTPTPLAIPGGTTIDTAGLQHLLVQHPPPRIVQVGRFREVLPGAIMLTDEQAAASRQAMDGALFGGGPIGDTGIVVMGTGTAGVQGYNAALHLISLGYPKVFWYRGGEEAWAAHGLPADDKREE
jgi:DNA-binding winged helix-turn-helix (wHTH) protein/TolB-like protein